LSSDGIARAWRLVCLVVVGVLATTAATATAAHRVANGFTTVKTLQGIVSRDVTTQLPNGPLVFSLSFQGPWNFMVTPVGRRPFLVFAQGSNDGQFVADTKRGRHHVVVSADGPWKVQVFRPTTAAVRALAGTFKGIGYKVFTVRSARARKLVLRASNAGDSNFVVSLDGYAGLNVSDLLVNEIGPWRGRTLVNAPAGYMLLSVEAEGAWSLRFAT
jgi:hypothetical protein